MLASEASYDVYNSPRIGAVPFGDFLAAEGNERETLLKSSKYVRRAHRARAYFAREQITSYLLKPVHNIASIQGAIEEAKADSTNPSHSEGKQADALASLEALRGFVGLSNILEIGGKDLIPADEDPQSLNIGGTEIPLELACLVRSYDKDKNERIGAIFLNSQKGRGLGTKDTAKAKRHRAGETVALLVLQRLINQYSDVGQPFHKDAIHVYLRAKHVWTAPKFFTNRLANMEAEGRAIASMWPTIKPPSDFDPENATFHN